MPTIYTDVQDLDVSSNGQTSFTISAVDNKEDSILIYGGSTFIYGEDYSISGTTLTWSGVTLSSGEKLHLISNPSDVDLTLYKYREVVSVGVSGQTEFYLTRVPDNQTKVVAIYNLIGFPVDGGIISVTDYTLTWSGVSLAKNDILKVYY